MAKQQSRKKLIVKIEKMRGRGYIGIGTVKSLSTLFCVPRGDQDTRVMYDTSKSGLMKSVRDPNFYLPTVESTLKLMSMTHG